MIGHKLLGLGLVVLFAGGANTVFAQQKAPVARATFVSDQAGALPASLAIYRAPSESTLQVDAVKHRKYRSYGSYGYSSSGYVTYGTVYGSSGYGPYTTYGNGQFGYSPRAHLYGTFGFTQSYPMEWQGSNAQGIGIRTMHFGDNYAYPLAYPMPYGYSPSYGYYGSVKW